MNQYFLIEHPSSTSNQGNLIEGLDVKIINFISFLTPIWLHVIQHGDTIDFISHILNNNQNSQLLLIINQRMNVVRDLRNTITHLQAELEKKQKYIKRQQQDYQQIITNLQAENQKLKQLLQGDSISHMHKDDQFLKEQSPHDSISKKESVSNAEWTEMVNQNIFLRNQIIELSTTYQKQIDQLVFYFEKIKHENKRISPGHSAGQIKMMGSWIQTCLRDFESQRQKYDRKLLECGQTLDIYQKKFQEQNQQIANLRSLLQQSQQKLKIVSRIHW